jgi:hypothetical protein
VPDLTIVVCRWAGPAFTSDEAASFVEAGANHVSTSLTDTRNYLRGYAPMAVATAPAIALAEKA